MSESSDQSAFEELFNIYYTWLHTVAISIVRKKEDAEEIVEDVFLKLWEIRDGFSRIKNLETFLYTATKNKSYDYYKKNSKVHLVEFEKEWKDKEQVISPEEAYLYAELLVVLQAAVDRLPPKCREVYILIKEKGYSYQKTADVLGISIKTVENHMRAGIQKLREDLQVYIKSSTEESVKKTLMIFLCL